MRVRVGIRAEVWARVRPTARVRVRVKIRFGLGLGLGLGFLLVAQVEHRAGSTVWFHVATRTWRSTLE